MEHKIKFASGHDCIKFECAWGHKNCAPGNGGSHGKSGLHIYFATKGDLGAIEFVLNTGWYPQFASQSSIGERHCDWGGSAYPVSIEYHSKAPMYDDHEASAEECGYVDGGTCYSGDSLLDSHDAMYALVNGGEEALWAFLDGYYEHIFNDAPYPQPAEYKMPLRKWETSMDAFTKTARARAICHEWLGGSDEWWTERYAEPDYQFIHCTLVVVGDWTNEREVVSAWEVDPAWEISERGRFYCVYDALELLGCRMEWIDEWEQCSKCKGAVRTKPSSATWKPSYVTVNDEVICHECFRTKGFLS